MLVVEAGGGLIGQQHGRAAQQGARQGHAQRLPGGKLVDAALQQIAQAQGVDQVLEVAGVERLAAGVGDQLQVVVHVQGRAEQAALRQKADLARAPVVALALRQARRLHPGNFEQASAGCEQPGQQRQPGRFAAARGAAQQQRLAAGAFQIGVSQRGSIAPAVAQC